MADSPADRGKKRRRDTTILQESQTSGVFRPWLTAEEQVGPNKVVGKVRNSYGEKRAGINMQVPRGEVLVENQLKRVLTERSTTGQQHEKGQKRV